VIIFGSKSKVVQGQYVEGDPQFGTFGLMKYFHIFWIPVIPVSRKAGMECTHCKKTLVGKELPPDLSSKIKKTVFTKKNMVPMFAGLIIFVALGIAVDINTKLEDSNSDNYVESPAVGDLYVVNFDKIFEQPGSDYKYGVMRVKQTFEDGVELDISKNGYTRSSGTDKAIRKGETSTPDFFESEPIFVENGQLKTFRESGAILSVTRD
jgi:hypothetical protein